MRNHLLSLGIGACMLVVGLVLWATTQDVETPVVSLSKAGVVLAVLGVVELVITAAVLALPSMRHRNYDL
jgi:hypothetical protein